MAHYGHPGCAWKIPRIQESTYEGEPYWFDFGKDLCSPTPECGWGPEIEPITVTGEALEVARSLAPTWQGSIAELEACARTIAE
jgi:hypothetical protein